MPYFDHDNIRFHYLDSGSGRPFIFQHGLGGDVNQTAEVYDLPSAPQGIRFIALDCRAHGETYPPGPEDKISFSSFADDVIALMKHLGVQSALVGGISMGAGISLNLALRYPERVSGLVLSRLAWLDQPLPPNMEVFVQVGELIQQYGAQKGLSIFQQSPEYKRLLIEAPDTASSLVGQFQHARAEETVVKLLRIPRDAPCSDRTAWSHIAVPALILANHSDPPHPFVFGEVAAGLIPDSHLKTLTPKSVNKQVHLRESRDSIREFICQYFQSTQ